MRLRRSTTLMLTGLGIATAAVLFFVVTTMRDDTLLHRGRQVTSTVVRTIPAAGWDFLDNGRNVVRYSVDGHTYTRALWLDETADARPAGARWTVVIDPADPGRVRSLTDGNDPAPLGFAIAVVGLLALLVGAGARITEWRYGRSWWTTFNVPRSKSGLSAKEELGGVALVLLVDGVLIAATSILGWDWFIKFGRLTLTLPTLATFSLWRSWRLYRRRRFAIGPWQ